MAFKFDTGYLYSKALIGMGYTQVSVTGISSMFSQEEFENDYVTSIASETGVGISTAWKNYRQELRDITKQSDVNNLVWPTHPEGVRVGFLTGYEPCNEI
jgi:hypothetical protein